MSDQTSLSACCIAEVIGTFILIFFGCGVVHVAVTLGAVSGIVQAAVVWGLGVALAVYVIGGISGGHINPAITLAMAIWSDFPRNRVLPYWAAQLVGAMLAAACLHVMFADTIAAYEAAQGIVRGEESSVVTASMYGEYFPNPTVALHADAGQANVSVAAAAFMEIICTALLALCVFALTDEENSVAPLSNLAPVLIGLTVAALIVVIGAQTQACLNPARDFGPRIVAYFAGWGEVAFPGPRGAGATLLVYLVSPLTGGILGGLLYTKVIGPAHQAKNA